jgi:hypothetical protein
MEHLIAGLLCLVLFHINIDKDRFALGFLWGFVSLVHLVMYVATLVMS